MTQGELALMQENHREVLNQLAAIRVELKDHRLEAKSDLAAHDVLDSKAFAVIDKSITDLRIWRAKTVGALCVVMFLISTVTTVLTSLVIGGTGG